MSVIDLLRSLFSTKTPRVNATEAAEHIANGALLVDVRTPSEFSRKHIDGAINLPLNTLPASLPSSATAIVVYCSSGHRSRVAKTKIGEKVECFDLGPMSAWRNT